MNPTTACTFSLELNPEERAELLQVLEQVLKDVRIEEHRTKTLGYRQVVAHRESILEGVTEKLRQPAAAGA